MIAPALPKVVDCFKNGGGVPYSGFPGFAKIESDVTKNRYEDLLFEAYLPLLPESLQQKLKEGANVLDVGCGSGHCSNMLAKTFPNSNFWGVDLAQDAIEAAKEEAKRMNLTNVHFYAQDVTRLTPSHPLCQQSFDLITLFMVLHDISHPLPVLKSLLDILADDGILFIQETNSTSLEQNALNPRSSIYYTISLFHCMTQSLAEGGAGLGVMTPNEDLKKLIHDSGFPKVDILKYPAENHKVFFQCSK